MTQIEFLDTGFYEGFLCIETYNDNTYGFGCTLLTCYTCEYSEVCSTIKCGLETYHPELFQYLKDKLPHLFI